MTTRLLKFTISALTITAASLLFGVGAASATERSTTSDGAPTMTTFADLDVSHPSGAKILYRRIQYAARAVRSSPT